MSKLPAACSLLTALLTLSASIAAAQPASGGATLHGRVTDSESHEPVGQAEVVVIHRGIHGTTEDDGSFVLERVPAGTCTLSVTRMGYAPLRRELTVV